MVKPRNTPKSRRDKLAAGGCGAQTRNNTNSDASKAQAGSSRTMAPRQANSDEHQNLVLLWACQPQHDTRRCAYFEIRTTRQRPREIDKAKRLPCSPHLSRAFRLLLRPPSRHSEPSRHSHWAECPRETMRSRGASAIRLRLALPALSSAFQCFLSSPLLKVVLPIVKHVRFVDDCREWSDRRARRTVH